MHLELDVHNFPCDFIDASFMIRKGKRHNFARHRLIKSSNGTVTVDPAVFSFPRNPSEIIKALDAGGEGCKFVGSVFLHLVQTRMIIFLSNKLTYLEVNKELKK